MGARCAAADLVVVGRRTGDVLQVDAVLKGESAGTVDLPPVPRDFDGSEALTRRCTTGSEHSCSRTAAGTCWTGPARPPAS